LLRYCYYFSYAQKNDNKNQKVDDNMRRKESGKQTKITEIAITGDKMSGHCGLFFFLKYAENIGFTGSLKRSLVF